MVRISMRKCLCLPVLNVKLALWEGYCPLTATAPAGRLKLREMRIPNVNQGPNVDTYLFLTSSSISNVLEDILEYRHLYMYLYYFPRIITEAKLLGICILSKLHCLTVFLKGVPI